MGRVALLGLGFIFLPFFSMLLAGCRSQYTIEVNGARRAYQLFVPEGHTEPMPLVIALHPFLLNGAQMRRMTRLDAIAQEEGFIVAYPYGKKRRWDVRSADTKDVLFINALIDELIANLNVDPRRVFLTGASNGAMMCHLMSCRSPERIAAIAPVMGTPPRDVLAACAAAPPMPMLMIHGTEDPIVRYENGAARFDLASVPETILFWVRRNGCATQPNIVALPDADPEDGTTVDLFTYSCTEAPVFLYRVNGGGHTWPGNTGYVPQCIVGRVSNDINASRIIWDFFNAFPKPAPSSFAVPSP